MSNKFIFENERVWRWLTNFWTVVLFILIFANFFSKNAYSFLLVPLSIVYSGILTIFVATKEFDRWYEVHDGRHPGEFFVIAWTAVMAVLLTLSFVFGEEFHAPSDTVSAVYVAVLTLFALTQKSKNLHHRKRR